MLGNNLLALLTTKEKQFSTIFNSYSEKKRKCTPTIEEKLSAEDLKLDTDKLKVTKRKNRPSGPSLSLSASGTAAELCLPDDKREPLLVSQLKLVFSHIPGLRLDQGISPWFEIKKAHRIPNACLVIVDGITVTKLQNLHLGTKEMRRLHRKRLRKGLTAPYLSPTVDSDSPLSGHNEDCTKSQRVEKDNESEEPPKKRLKHFRPEVQDGLQSWLPLTSSVLPARVEVVSPVLYGNSTIMDLFLTPLSHSRVRDLKYDGDKRPETLRLLDSDQVLYRRARGETLKSCHSPSSTLSQQFKQPEQNPGVFTNSANVMYHSQLVKRWDKSMASAETSYSKYWQKGFTPEDIKNLKSDKFDRRSLLMNLDDMLYKCYPMHPKVHFKFTSANCKDGLNYSEYVGTKDSYIPVRADSPLFAVDCEFFIRASRKNVDKIAIVNESGQVVYRAELARHECKDCTNTDCVQCSRPSIEDVQKHIIQHLPPDGILVGHGLDSDFSALKMYHPYVIDTALVFDLEKEIVPSLRSLARRFLGEAIQLRKYDRHDPTEDALVTLRLVQLKLQHDFTFGRQSLGGFIPPVVQDYYEKEAIVDKVYYVHWFERLYESMTATTSKPVHTRVRTLIEKCFKREWRKCFDRVPKELSYTRLSDAGAVVDSACADMAEFDLSIVHFKADERINSDDASDRLDALAEVDAQLARLYGALPVKSLLTVLFIDSCHDDPQDPVHNGLFMVGIKGNE